MAGAPRRRRTASRPRPATIAEVAQAAGVSPATVSRVLNGHFVGEPSVAERVRATAADLDYRPNHLARALALGQTQAIAFVVPDLANPAFQAVLSGLSKTAARDGYRVLVADSAESPSEEALLASEIRRRCDALVLCAPRMSDEELDRLAAGLQPLVLINRPYPGVQAPSLSIDYRSGIQAVVRHLHSLGHRHLAYLEGPEHSISNTSRLQGLDDLRSDLPDLRIDNLPCGAASEDGQQAVDAVLATGATAAVAFNDLVAVGLIAGLLDRGLHVPDDLSVTGFDDIPFARYLHPALTTASVPYADLGAQAWRRMHALLTHQPPEPDLSFAPHVEPRESTAPPA